MLRYSHFILALFLLYFQSPQDSDCQTIKQRSEQAYKKLAQSSGPERVSLLCELADYRSADSVNRARELAHSAVNYAATTGNKAAVSKALLMVSRVLFNTGDIDSSHYFLVKSQKLKLESHDLNELDRVYFQWGLIFQRKGDYKTAIGKFQQGLQFARLNNNYPLEVRCYTELANCYRPLDNMAELNRMTLLAEKSLEKGGDSLQICNACVHLGLLFFDIGNYERSVASYFKAIRIAEVICDSLSLGYMYCNLSGVFGSAPKAMEFNKKALQVFKNTGNKRGMAYALNNLGMIALGAKEYATAVQYFLEAGHLKVEVADWQGAGFVYNNLVEHYCKTADLKIAGKFLLIGEYYAKRAGDKLSMAVYYNTAGIYYSSLKNHAQARALYEKSLYLAEDAKIDGLISSNLESISATYDAEGKPGEALSFYKKYTARKDSVAHQNNLKAIAEMQIKYDTEKKESQIKEMSRLIMNSSVKNRSFLTGNIAIAILILLVFILVFYRTQNRLKPEISLIHEPARSMPETDHLSVVQIPDQASKPILTPDQQKALWKELNQLMSDEKVFLNSSIKLSDLAGRLNTNTSYLSKVINELSGENFCNYLNNLRVSEARKLLADPGNQHLTIEGIAQTVGFNSKSAFNTAFKKYTSLTPSEFISSSISMEKNVV
jgi:AraC-like DNA-binding protein